MFATGLMSALKELAATVQHTFRIECTFTCPEPVPVSSAAPNMQLDEHLEAKLDAVLEKVARFGQASLTDAERQILLKASEIYKRKRS